MLQDLSRYTPFKVGEMEGILTELVALVGKYVGKGYRVELGDFGTFSGKVKSRLVANKEDIRSDSVYFNGINFQASNTFKEMATGSLIRNKHWKFHQSSEIDEERRKEALLAHLDEHGFITRTTYGKLTGRLKDMALKDLKTFAGQGIIEQKGRGNQLHFVKVKENKEE